MKLEEREIIEHYFPQLTDTQWQKLEQLPSLYREWNAKINVISRKDIDNVVIHHLLHSMSIALFTRFVPSTKVIDVGTGGGFPGLPLAILFPECAFTLVDSIGKKVRVAESIGTTIGLKNVSYVHARAEELKTQAHFMVSRATMPATDLMKIAKRLLTKKEQLNALPNGIIALKGGDLTEELRPFVRLATEETLAQYIPNIPFFETKKVIHIPL